MASNPDFRDLLSALSAEGADFLVVGAHAVMFYTVPRFTKDLDVWVRPTPTNAQRVYRALATFGAPLSDLTVEDLTRPGTIFQMGVAPNRIDIVTSIDGVSFPQAWKHRVATRYDGVPIQVLGKQELVVNKRAVGRPQDQLDLSWLEKPAPRRRRKPRPRR